MPHKGRHGLSAQNQMIIPTNRKNFFSSKEVSHQTHPVCISENTYTYGLLFENLIAGCFPDWYAAVVLQECGGLCQTDGVCGCWSLGVLKVNESEVLPSMSHLAPSTKGCEFPAGDHSPLSSRCPGKDQPGSHHSCGHCSDCHVLLAASCHCSADC